MEITLSIGPETDERSVSITISDDVGWSPDQITDACNRAVTAALVAWTHLHTAAVDTYTVVAPPNLKASRPTLGEEQ